MKLYKTASHWYLRSHINFIQTLEQTNGLFSYSSSVTRGVIYCPDTVTGHNNLKIYEEAKKYNTMMKIT